MRNTLVGALALVLLALPAAWAANAGHGPQEEGLTGIEGVPAALRAKIVTDEKAVKADRQALDAAEQAAGLTPTFPPAEKPKGKSKPPAPATPAQRIAHMLDTCEKELAKVAKLQTQPGLPAAVATVAQTLTTDLNTLKADLTAAQNALNGPTAPTGPAAAPAAH